MVLVPAGEFVMGDDRGMQNERPRRELFLDPTPTRIIPHACHQAQRLVEVMEMEGEIERCAADTLVVGESIDENLAKDQDHGMR